MPEINHVKVMILNPAPDDHRVYINKILENYPQVTTFYPASQEEQLKLAPDMQVIVGREVDIEVLDGDQRRFTLRWKGETPSLVGEALTLGGER